MPTARWGLDVRDAGKLKSLEAENTKLKKILAEQMPVIEDAKAFSEKMSTPAGRR